MIQEKLFDFLFLSIYMICFITEVEYSLVMALNIHMCIFIFYILHLFMRNRNLIYLQLLTLSLYFNYTKNVGRHCQINLYACLNFSSVVLFVCDEQFWLLDLKHCHVNQGVVLNEEQMS